MKGHLEKIDNYLQSLDAASREDLEQISMTKRYPKQSYLLEHGKIAHCSLFIISGTARKFYLHDGKEITNEFYFRQDIAVSMQSYCLQSPSKEFIQAVEDCEVSAIDYHRYNLLKKSNNKIAILDTLMLEYYAMWLEDRLYRLQTMSATQRYLFLLEKNPEIIQHIKLGHIATYLGISMETLSRIRKKLA